MLLAAPFYTGFMNDIQATAAQSATAPYASELKLAQALVQVDSPSKAEGEVMRRMLEAFTSLGFDDAYLDKAGNAIGTFKRGEGPTVMFNGHLDTVPTGDPALWPHGPLSGEVVDGELWGRGSVDMKSALACMAFGAKDAVEAGFAGTIIVSAVVQEEIGGLGARYIGDTVAADVVILGEPSDLNFMLGHRGRLEVHVEVPGKIAHAAKSELGDNALYHAAAFLRDLETLPLPMGGPLGRSTLTPTNLRSQPETSANVVPGSAQLVLDYRNIPGDEPETILTQLKALLPNAAFTVDEVTARSENGEVELSYSHYIEPYLAPGENRLVEVARASLKKSLQQAGVPFEERVWWFATDAPHLAKTGAPVVGFGPGNENLAHTTNERVPVRHLEVCRAAYRDLALAYSEEAKSD